MLTSIWPRLSRKQQQCNELSCSEKNDASHLDSEVIGVVPSNVSRVIRPRLRRFLGHSCDNIGSYQNCNRSSDKGEGVVDIDTDTTRQTNFIHCRMMEINFDDNKDTTDQETWDSISLPDEANSHNEPLLQNRCTRMRKARESKSESCLDAMSQNYYCNDIVLSKFDNHNDSDSRQHNPIQKSRSGKFKPSPTWIAIANPIFAKTAPKCSQTSSKKQCHRKWTINSSLDSKLAPIQNSISIPNINRSASTDILENSIPHSSTNTTQSAQHDVTYQETINSSSNSCHGSINTTEISNGKRSTGIILDSDGKENTKMWKSNRLSLIIDSILDQPEKVCSRKEQNVGLHHGSQHDYHGSDVDMVSKETDLSNTQYEDYDDDCVIIDSNTKCRQEDVLGLSTQKPLTCKLATALTQGQSNSHVSVRIIL
jgi:hypothetical protein